MEQLSLQQQAQQKSLNTKIPHAKDERFTYVPTQYFKTLTSSHQNDPSKNRFCTQNEYDQLTENKKYFLLFDNGFYQDQSQLPDGIEVLSSLFEQKDWQTHIEGMFKNEKDWLALQAFSNAPALAIRIKKSIKAPIHLVYCHSDKNTLPQNFVVTVFLDEQVDIHLSVEIIGHEKTPINMVSNFFLKPYSKLHYTANHKNVLPHSWFHKLNIWQKQNSIFKGHSISKGSQEVARESADIFLLEPKTQFNWYGLSKLNSKNQFHRHLEVHHLASDTFSNQLFRNVLTDQAKSSVNGTISIIKGVNQVNGNQLINNLMLSDQSQSNNKPNLQIYADDIKCSHGVTVGKLDENQLIYLQSRGYNKEQAEKALTFGFLLELIKEIESPIIRNSVLKHL